MAPRRFQLSERGRTRSDQLEPKRQSEAADLEQPQQLRIGWVDDPFKM
jgi:hypothetical protein